VGNPKDFTGNPEWIGKPTGNVGVDGRIILNTVGCSNVRRTELA
jgi:hypothetical protein